MRQSSSETDAHRRIPNASVIVCAYRENDWRIERACLLPQPAQTDAPAHPASPRGLRSPPSRIGSCRPSFAARDLKPGWGFSVGEREARATALAVMRTTDARAEKPQKCPNCRKR